MIGVAGSETRALIMALALVLGGCRDSGVVAVEEDRCGGIIGDPSIPTSCVIVQGRVRDAGGVPVSSVNVTADCFGTETLGCGATPGETNGEARIG